MRQLFCLALGAFALFAQAPKFRDIGGHPAKAAIQSMCKQGILHGRAAGEFAPDEAMTRAEFAAALQRMFRLSPPAQAHVFPDVPPGSANYAAAQAIAPHLCREMLCFRCALGKNFLPNAIVTRAEMTMVLTHILISQNKLEELDEPETQRTLAQVSDVERIPRLCRPYFAAAIRDKLLELKEGNTVALPAAPTRAEMAMCMAGVKKKYKVKPL